MLRQHQARLRFSPSKCAILPSVRSLTVAGVNKVVPDIGAAFQRLRNEAAVGDCRALGKQTPCALTGQCDNYACAGPDRQCGKVLIIEQEKIPGRITVVLIGERLGY